MVDAPVTCPSVTWETPDHNTPCGAYPYLPGYLGSVPGRHGDYLVRSKETSQ